MKTWLVFWTWMFHDPSVIMGPETSATVFESRQQCIDFVNTIATQEVAEADGSFRFSSNDGIIFYGRCIQNKQELDDIAIRIMGDPLTDTVH